MSGTTTAVLRQRLSEAEDALHRLMLGESVTVMQHRAGEQGTNVTYTPADEARLQKYIQTLRRALGDLPRRHAMRIRF